MRINNILAIAAILTSAAAAANDVKLEQSRSRQMGGAMRLGFMAGIPQVGAEAVYRVRDNVELGGSYTGGSIDIAGKVDDDQKDVKSMDIKGSMAKVFGRYYPAQNSFFVSGGLGYRKIAANAVWDDFSGRQTFDMDRRAMTANVGVGNLWKWDNGFQIGADWIEVAVPVIHTKRDAEYTHSDDRAFSRVGEENRQNAEDIANRVGKRASLQVMFNIGYNF